MKNIPLTVPNVFSLFRLFSFPFVMIFIFAGWYNVFVFFMWLNLTTDILDGFLARRLKLVSETGAKLDGLADTGTYILGLTGIFVYKWQDFEPYALPFFIFLVLFLFSRLFSFVKFRRFYGYQTYSGKSAGYIHGTFFLVLFIFGFYKWFCILMIASGIFVFTENILITVILREARSHVKGLYWVIKNKN